MSSRISKRPWGSHFRYALDGDRVPSVTTILGHVSPKVGLRYWYAEEAAKWAADHPLSPDEDRDDWIDRAKKAANRTTSAAAEAGKSVHAMAHDLLDGRVEGVPAELVPKVEQIARFLERFEVEEIAAERPCASTTMRYAGTFDLLCSIGGTIWLLDYKSGKSVWPDQVLQLVGYASTDLLQLDDETDVVMPHIERMGFVHVRDDGLDLLPVYDPNNALPGYWQRARDLADLAEQTKIPTGDAEPRWQVIGEPIQKPAIAS